MLVLVRGGKKTRHCKSINVKVLTNRKYGGNIGKLGGRASKG
jgi:hypothetical protein